MNFWQALFLGIVQGATEFLPVSSSGHLVLVPWLLEWDEPGLAFDAVAHLGTMVAVLAYFWRDWLRLLQGGWFVVRRRSLDHSDGRVLVLLIGATVPAGLAGLLLEDFFERVFSEPPAAGVFLLVTAGLLVAAERLGDPRRVLSGITWIDALLIGVAQAFAIFPGISRSGATISTGLARGLRREEAARFSFLLATPVVLAAGGKKLLEVVADGALAEQGAYLFGGFLGAMVVGYVCIWWLLGFLRRQRLYPFAVYCAAFGVFCLAVAALRA